MIKYFQLTMLFEKLHLKVNEVKQSRQLQLYIEKLKPLLKAGTAVPVPTDPCTKRSPVPTDPMYQQVPVPTSSLY